MSLPAHSPTGQVFVSYVPKSRGRRRDGGEMTYCPAVACRPCCRKKPAKISRALEVDPRYFTCFSLRSVGWLKKFLGSSINTKRGAIVGLWPPSEDPEDPPVDLHVDVGRSEDLPVAVPDARPRQPSLALLGHHSEAATGKDPQRSLILFLLVT